jgi:hypothetical protein
VGRFVREACDTYEREKREGPTFCKKLRTLEGQLTEILTNYCTFCHAFILLHKALVANVMPQFDKLLEPNVDKATALDSIDLIIRMLDPRFSGQNKTLRILGANAHVLMLQRLRSNITKLQTCSVQ